MSNETSVKIRKSGIELLKIIAMLLIVTIHCERSFTIDNSPFLQFVDISLPTTNITSFVAQVMYYFGMLGNTVFLICSVWFLVDSNNMKLNKIAHIVFNVFIISVIFLLIFGIWFNLSTEDIIKSLFPTIFSNYWYITCYLLLYSIHPLLNITVNKLSQKQHLAYNCTFFFLYFCIGSLKEAFFVNNLICFIGIYFIVAYVKKYNSKMISNLKINIIFFFAGIILLILLQLGINFAGFRINSIGQNLYYFANMHNPIIIIISLSMFNIFRNLKIQSRIVNYISSLTMFIYVIHENILFRKYLRPYLIFDFWEFSGRINIVLLVLICSLILFSASITVAAVYNKLLQPIAEKIADKILQICLNLYSKFESFMLKLE